MDNSGKRKIVPAEPPQRPERRRIGTVVHDDRGNASVTWRDAPEDLERPVLEVLGDPALTLKNEESFDPYARGGQRPGGGHGQRPGGGHGQRQAGGNGARTDLRKLSEWIKMMRELETRKKNEDD